MFNKNFKKRVTNLQGFVKNLRPVTLLETMSKINSVLAYFTVLYISDTHVVCESKTVPIRRKITSNPKITFD